MIVITKAMKNKGRIKETDPSQRQIWLIPAIRVQ